MEKVSVIVPIYNSEEHLKRCLDSIINQTYQNLEIILIDDGSIDNSYNICLEYRNRDKRIKVVKQKNMGAGIARDKAIKKSTGKFITFVDSDDYLNKDYVEYLYNMMIKYNCDIAVTSLYDSGKEKIKVVDSNQGLKMLADFKIDFAACGKMYQRKRIIDVFFSNTKNYEDIMFVGKAFFYSKIVAISNQQKYFYIKRDNSQSTKKFNITEFDRIKNSYELYKFISNCDFKIGRLYKLYYYANYLGVINKMIMVDNIDCSLVNRIRNEFKNDILYLWFSNYSMRRKIQYTCFILSFDLYKIMYKYIINRKD